MKNQLKSFAVLIVVALALIGNILLPAQDVSAALKGDGKDKAKNFLYAAALYSCVSTQNISNDAIKNVISSGADFGTIFTDPNAQGYIGTWLGDSNGMIKCSDAAKHALKNGRTSSSNFKITDDEISSGLLKNVYTKNTSSYDKTLTCQYKIINSEGKAYISDGKLYTWPQGYTGLDKDDDHLEASPITIYYTGDNNNRVYTKFTGGGSGINPDLGNELANITPLSCSAIVPLEVFPMPEDKSYYEGILYNANDANPFGDVIDFTKNRNQADIKNTLKEETKTLTTSSSLVRSNDAITNLQTNIKNEFFNGKDPGVYLANNGNLQYVIYGRYLFNGDGKMPASKGGCGGITVSKSDPNFSKLSTSVWDQGLSNVAEIKAYPDKTGSKKDYLTKFGRDSAQPYMLSTLVTCKDLANLFNGLKVTNIASRTTVKGFMSVTEIAEDGTVAGLESISDGMDDDGESLCFDGAGALGWILCPVLTAVSDAIQFAYEQIIEPFLQVDAGLFSSEYGSYKSWQIFQSFANILFVIMLLFVIFSQLTGIGIDNYGIKKILPRLIISAILINLSYIICQLAVDISNILGVGLKSLFDGLAEGVPLAGGSVSAGSTVLTGIVAGLAGAGALMASGGIGIILPLLLSLITTFIAILFVFVLLGARQAVVVILVVISPIAFVLYMLPNTKQYFDKLVKIFVSMLIIYPICGLLIGGGNFAAKVVLSAGQGAANDGFFFQLSGMLISIIPFFFIPSLVKGSFNAIGNIGSRVESLTRGAASRANSGVKNSHLYKDTMARSKAGINFRGESTRLGALRRRVAGTNNVIGRAMQRSMAAGQTDVLKGEAEQKRAEWMTDPTHIAAMAASDEAEAMRKQVGDQETLIRNMKDENGNYIANDFNKLGDMYTESLQSLSADPSDESSRNRIMALQNMMSKTDAGRAQIQNRLEDFVDNAPEGADRDGINAAASTAASHLLNEYGDTYKNKNRGFNNWIAGAAKGDVSSVGSHDGEGLNKYTAESLAGADEQAITRLARAYSSGKMNDDERKSFESKIDEMRTNPNIQVQGAFGEYLRKGGANDLADRLNKGPSEGEGSAPQPPTPGPTPTPSSGDMSEGQDVNIQNPTPAPNPPTPRTPSGSPDLVERVRQAEISSDGTLNIQGEGSFRQTDSGIIIPNRGDSSTNNNNNA